MHAILYLKWLYSLFLSGIIVLSNIILLLTRSCLSIAQASFSFKCLNAHMFTYATPTFVTEGLCLVTHVQLLLTTITVN